MTELSAEGIRAITTLADKASTAKLLESPSIPFVTFLDQGGVVREIAQPVAKRDHGFFDRDSFASAMLDLRTVTGEVYLSQDVITGLLDAERRETVKLRMVTTKQFAQLNQLPDDYWHSMTRQDALEMVEHNLAGAQGLEDLVAALEAIDFQVTTVDGDEGSHGSKKRKKTSVATVLQAESVPREVNVAVPLWNVVGFDRYLVTCRIRVRLCAENRTVSFRRYPDELTLAVGSAVQAATNDLRAHFEGAFDSPSDDAAEDNPLEVAPLVYSGRATS